MQSFVKTARHVSAHAARAAWWRVYRSSSCRTDSNTWAPQPQAAGYNLMRNSRSLLVAAITAAATSCSFAQSPKDSREDLVRAAYARTSLASRIASLEAHGPSGKSNPPSVDFTLLSVETGPTSRIQ